MVIQTLRRRPERRKQLIEIIEKFRLKGATSPERAMTMEDLSLPPRFKNAMNRRLGRLGIFMEVDGRYYLSEQRLREIEERLASRRRRW